MKCQELTRRMRGIKMKKVKVATEKKVEVIEVNELADQLIEEAKETPEGQVARLVERDGEYKVYSIEKGSWMSADRKICEIYPINVDDEDIDNFDPDIIVQMISEGI